MKTGVIIILVLSCCVISLKAQTLEQEILLLSGASSMEELDGSIIERLENLTVHPIPINTATRSRLLGCGLFSAFQVASLIDYREHSGDILSFAELGAVDGFSEAVAGALRRFVSLESGRSPGEAALRAADRLQLQSKGGVSGKKWSAAAKVLYEHEERLTLRAAYKNSLSGALEYHNRRQNLSFIIGDFAARFGQGLVQWNGFSLGGYPSISSFMKKGSGIAPAWTYSPDNYLRGVAATWEDRTDEASIYVTSDREAGAHFGRYWKNGQVGATAKYDKGGKWEAATDGRLSVRGFDLFGEACFDFSEKEAGGCLGTVWNHSSDLQAAARLSYEKSKPAASAALRYKTHFLSFEAGPARLRLFFQSALTLGRGLALVFRLVETRKPDDKIKHDLRADLSAGPGNLAFVWRSNIVLYRTFAHLHYAETAYKSGKAAIYARLTAFDIKNWDDRIYVYERNSPGSFSVPSYYGTGYAASIYASMKFRQCKFYLRTEYMKSNRNDGKFGLNASCVIDIL